MQELFRFCFLLFVSHHTSCHHIPTCESLSNAWIPTLNIQALGFSTTKRPKNQENPGTSRLATVNVSLGHGSIDLEKRCLCIAEGPSPGGCQKSCKKTTGGMYKRPEILVYSGIIIDNLNIDTCKLVWLNFFHHFNDK